MKIPSVLIAAAIPKFSRQMLPDNLDFELTSSGVLSQEEVIRRAQNKDALACTLVHRIDEEFFSRCPRIKMIANIAVGFDNVDLQAATGRGVLVGNTPGVLDDATADLTFALLLAAARRIAESRDYLLAGSWRSFSLDLLTGCHVTGKTLGIVGFGRIGQAVAKRAAGFSMRILYNRRNRLSREAEEELGAQYAQLPDLLAQSDFVCLHCPLTEQTFHLLDRPRLSLMKQTAYLINTSRGAVVDEQALIGALKDGLIAGAALDVFENEPQVPLELCSLPNVLAVPHIGSATVETRQAMAGLALSAISRAFAGVKPGNIVNAEVWPAFLARIRGEGLLNSVLASNELQPP